MKTQRFLTAALFVALSMTFISCSKVDGSDQEEGTKTILNVTEDGTSTLENGDLTPIFATTAALTADEIEFLYALREDEKLGGDLYAQFATQYPEKLPFAKIATAEDSHVACVERLLSYYEIEFPVLSPEGVFADEKRQTRYNEMKAKAVTVVDAFMVMAALEEEAVASYKKVVPQITNENILLVVNNMVKASLNHLRVAFRQISMLGGAYLPTFLSQEDFDAIVNSDFSQGHGYQYKHGKGDGKTNSNKKGEKACNKGKVTEKGDCSAAEDGSKPRADEGGMGKKYRGGRG